MENQDRKISDDIEEQEISERQFRVLKMIVSNWFTEHGCLDMLKVLFRDTVDNVKLAKITDTIDLMNELVIQGKMSAKDPTLLYDTIRISGHIALQTEIKKILPSFLGVEERTASTHFTSDRIKLIEFGKKLYPADVKRIDELYNEPLKMYEDSWTMISDLEDRMEITGRNMDEFIEELKILALPCALNALTEGEVPEVIVRGKEVLEVFNEELEQGFITVNHARLMVTGKEGVGKTCLVNSLLGRPFNVEEQSTNSIVLTSFDCREWEETLDIEDCERTKQMLENTIEFNVAKKLKQTQTGACELSLEPASAQKSTTTEHDVASNPAGTNPKIGEMRKKGVSNRKNALPLKIQKRIIDRLMGKTSLVPENEDISFIWDFAGQQVNYITHRIFLTSEAVYLILFNLAESMYEKGKRRFSKMAKYVMTYDMTNIQIIKYWMMLIFTYAIPVNAQQELQAKKPQIVVVGTHSDCLEGTEEDKKKQIEEQYAVIFHEIRGTPYESHVVRKIYAISNKFAQCKMLETLKADVGGFLKAMPKTIPLKWLKFQQILQENGRTAVLMPYIEVCKVATECGISVENLIHTLNYLHDLGIILYFENNRLLKHTVITNPRKLIDIFKKIITEVDPDDDDKWPLMIEYWNKLDDQGILEERLVRHLWRDEITRDETCFEVFLELLKQFGLICERNMNQESAHRSFFVPCRLKHSTDNVYIKSDSDQMVSIYMTSEDFIPDSVFHPLVVSLIRMVQDMGYTAELDLFSNYANIHLGRDHTLCLGPVVIDNKPSLKLEILRMSVVREDGTATSTGKPSPRVCVQLLEFLKKEMKVLTTGMKHIGYAFRVLCWKYSQHAHFHDLDECLENNYIPCGKELITTGRLQRMFKSKKPVTGSLSLPDGNLGYVDDKHLYLIAKDMGLEGRQLGLRLGLHWDKIKQIWSDNRQLLERIMEMLTEWRRQQDYETNQVEIMCRALKDLGLTELANQVFGSQVSEDQSSHVEASKDHPSGRLHQTNKEHDGCLTDTDLHFIAERLGDDWEDLGICLYMKRSEIKRIANDFSPPVVDACMEMLVKWRSRQVAKINHLTKIIDALTILEREDIIQELITLLPGKI